MSKKAKLALLALLGFSTACSTVKNGAKSETEATETQEQVEQSAPQIRVLYGVRPPRAEEEIKQALEAEQEKPQTENSAN